MDYLTEEDLFNGDVAALNKRISQQFEDELAKRLSEQKDSKQESAGEDSDGKAVETYTREQLDGFDPAGLGYAVFKDDDEDVRETAALLFQNEMKKLSDGASRDDVEAAAERVSKRMAKMSLARGEEHSDGYDAGPVPMNTSGAAAAHIMDSQPSTVEEAEELSAKIAASFK